MAGACRCRRRVAFVILSCALLVGLGLVGLGPLRAGIYCQEEATLRLLPVPDDVDSEADPEAEFAEEIQRPDATLTEMNPPDASAPRAHQLAQGWRRMLRRVRSRWLRRIQGNRVLVCRPLAQAMPDRVRNSTQTHRSGDLLPDSIPSLRSRMS